MATARMAAALAMPDGRCEATAGAPPLHMLSHAAFWWLRSLPPPNPRALQFVSQGANCSETVDECRPSPCLNGGICLGSPVSACLCPPGWYGERCDIRACPLLCSAHGVCGADGTCTCESGWGGAGCQFAVPEEACPFNCSGVGHCVHGGCALQPPASRTAMSVLPTCG